MSCSSLVLSVLIGLAASAVAVPIGLHAESYETVAPKTPGRLRFSSDETFRIIQLADLHFGEAPGSWGPAQDSLSLQYIKSLLGYVGADLVVLSGDQLSAGGIDKNATAYWDIITNSLGGIPHTAILGNHDAEPPHADGNNQSLPGAHTNRSQLMQHDLTIPTSFSQLGPSNLRPAASVYIVDVWPNDPAAEIPELQLVHLDSGGGGMQEEVFKPQVTWMNTALEKRRQRFGRLIPTLVFVHIPLWEFKGAMQHGAACVGEQTEGVTPTLHNTGLFAAIDANKEVVGVFVGHDHCNDFCCKVGRRAVDLCFGRHSSRGGYECDGYDNGARVIELQTHPWKASTHIRLVNGTVIHRTEL